VSQQIMNAISTEKKEFEHELNSSETVHVGGQYGSTGTLSTHIYLESSSSSCSQKSSTSQSSTNTNHVSHIDKIDSSKVYILLPRHPRDCSYSNISSDGCDCCNRNTLIHQGSRGVCYFIENSVLTLHNFKVTLSFVLWFITYMIMGVFGGSVAFLHFERTSKDVPDPLPDFGYDVIPYWCPILIPHYSDGNIQTIVLFLLYTLILSGIILRWKPRCHPVSGTIICGGDGRLILQHMCHLNCLVFLTRTTVVGLTGLPQPNPRCVDKQNFPVTFLDAITFVMGRGFPPHACGDLIYSGHVGCTLVCMAVLHRHGFLRNRLQIILVWILAAIGIYFTISCRSHYSVDVVLAFYFGYFLPEWYFNRSDGRVRGIISNLIRQFEVRPVDLEGLNYDDVNENKFKQFDSKYPSTTSV